MQVKGDGAAISIACSGMETHFIPTDVIVKDITPLTPLSPNQIREVVQRFDDEKKGGLSEMQWVRFCEEYHKCFASVGAREISFERFQDFCALGAAEEPTRATRAVRGVLRFLEGFAAGGVAGAISKTVIAPADKVKIIFQVDSDRHFSLSNAYRAGKKTVREHGVTGLWIGNGAMMVRVVPYAAVTFATYDYYHEGFQYLLYDKRTDSGTGGRAVAVRFLSGSFSGATATACTYPLDLMRARLATHSVTSGIIPSYRCAYKSLVSEHGWKALYSGLVPTLIGIMPYAGCSFAVFETLKSYIVRWNGLPSDKAIPVRERIIAGGLAGLVAQSATYPLDIVRRRMQVTPGRYRGVLHALRVIYKEEGFAQGWYKGLVMNWIKGPVAVGTAFTVNDMVKRRIRDYNEKAAKYPHRKNLVSLPVGLACGAVAVLTAQLCTCAVLRIKALLYVGASFCLHAGCRCGPSRTIAGVKESLTYSGGVTMMQMVSYGAFTYSLFDPFQAASERLLFSLAPTPATNFVAGLMSGALATVMMYPIACMSARVISPGPPYRFHPRHWLLHDIPMPKYPRSFREWSSFALLGVAPVAGVAFSVYELLKDRYGCNSSEQRFLAGVFASFTGHAVAYFLNMGRCQGQLRQLTRMGSTNFQGMSIHSTPFSSFCRSIPLGWPRGAFTFGVSLAINDLCRDVVIKEKLLRNIFLGLGA
uniref:Putative mitochondrial carrier protein n=1 Tax=Trypanosoma congolense (strain IL3000) TaxID=1068625 RepID=G0UW81_TRYCI|nr:putative mitochondrial carrier protein [Trypanosoma congolense IL3000]